MEHEAGLHDFDFLVGQWQVHHHRLKDRLAGSHDWVEFDGTTEMRKVLGGHGKMDDNVLNVPGDPYRAVTLRAFDEKTQQWSIWWLDGRTPGGSLEPALRRGLACFKTRIVSSPHQGRLDRLQFQRCQHTGRPRWRQGTGTTIIGLHAAAGPKPYRIAQSASLDGCDALTMLPDDSISAAAWSATGNPLVSAAGGVAMPFSDTFAYPWGEAYVAATDTQPAAIYVSNAPGGNIAAGGTIDRISLDGDAQTTFIEIASGFCSSGSPGMIYGPAGLTYDSSNDTLYIVERVQQCRPWHLEHRQTA